MNITVNYRHPAKEPNGINRKNTYVLSKDNKGWYVLNDNDEKLFYDLDIIKSMFIPSGNTWGNICLDESNQEENVNTEEVNKTIKEFTEDESEDKEEEYSYQNNYN